MAKAKPAKDGNFEELLAVHVAAGASIKDAAKVIGIAAQTAYNTSCTDGFRQRVQELRTEAVQCAVSSLSSAASQAVNVLVELLDVRHEAATRLNAAKAILAQLGPLSELGELRSRLDELSHATKV